MSKSRTRDVTAAKRTLLIEIGRYRLEYGQWPRAGRACDRLDATNDAAKGSGWRYLRELAELGLLVRQDGPTDGSTVYQLTEAGLNRIQSRRPDLVNELAARKEVEVHDGDQ